MRVFKAIKSALLGIWEAQKESLAGPLIRTKEHQDDALMLVILGDMIGFPLQSTYYSRVMLVYLMGRMLPWKKRVLKEHDIVDKMYD